MPDIATFDDNPAVKALVVESTTIATYAKSLSIRTAADYLGAGEFLQRVKGALGKLEAARTEITQPINEGLRRINAQAKAKAEPLQEAERVTKEKLLAYDREQERIRRAEQDRLNAIAAEQQRVANAAAAEARRRAEEQAALLRRQAEEAAAAGRAAEAARLQQRAVGQISRGENRAEQLELKAATTVAPVVTAQVPKVSGLSTAKIWKFRIVKAADIKREFLIADEVMIGKMVKAMGKGAEQLVGGIEAYEESVLASRSK